MCEISDITDLEWSFHKHLHIIIYVYRMEKYTKEQQNCVSVTTVKVTHTLHLSFDNPNLIFLALLHKEINRI